MFLDIEYILFFFFRNELCFDFIIVSNENTTSSVQNGRIICRSISVSVEIFTLIPCQNLFRVLMRLKEELNQQSYRHTIQYKAMLI